jgi:hypothetical protein
MSKQKAKTASQTEPAAAVDHLRDIIFGAQSREYEEKISDEETTSRPRSSSK